MSYAVDAVRTRGLPNSAPSNFLNLLYTSLLCPKLYCSANLQQLHQSLNRRPTEVTTDYTGDAVQQVCNLQIPPHPTSLGTFMSLQNRRPWPSAGLKQRVCPGYRVVLSPSRDLQRVSNTLQGSLTLHRMTSALPDACAKKTDSPKLF